MHGPSQPAWVDYADQMNYVGRNNWVLQAGVPQLDIAFWQKVTTYPGHIQLRTYEPTDLEDSGFTYEYLSPDNFALAAAKVVGGVLAPDAQAFQTLVVRANDSLTVDGVGRLVEFAHAGLPIVLAGGVPSSYIDTYSYNAMDIRKSKKNLQGITTLPNVHVTDDYHVAATLASLGIRARTQIVSTSPTNATIFTTWRHDNTTDIDYIYLYNDAMYIPQGQGAADVTIDFQSTGAPYEYNAWTGEQKPSTIIAFHCAGATAHVPHVEEMPQDVVGYSYNDNSSLVVMHAHSSRLALSNWTLIAEHWDPPADLYNISAGATKHNTTHHLPQLISWQQIPGLQNVSGRGYYSTTFDWPPNTTASGAILDFGWVYHTLRATLNGHPLPPLDVTAPRIDVGAWLVPGVNELEAVVATPLGNVLIPIWYQLQTSGEGPGSADASTVPPPVGQYGLQAEVMLTSYREEIVGE
ncbi:hypothetical protein LTR56_011172 [Elasticomyces elasticus]|nr:hypothetical protein LTR56_011172 [Elasticomyces elasticus]